MSLQSVMVGIGSVPDNPDLNRDIKIVLGHKWGNSHCNYIKNLSSCSICYAASLKVLNQIMYVYFLSPSSMCNENWFHNLNLIF